MLSSNLIFRTLGQTYNTYKFPTFVMMRKTYSESVNEWISLNYFAKSTLVWVSYCYLKCFDFGWKFNLLLCWVFNLIPYFLNPFSWWYLERWHSHFDCACIINDLNCSFIPIFSCILAQMENNIVCQNHKFLPMPY